MKRILTLLLVLVAYAGGRALTVTDTIFDRAAHEKDFAFGADIGFVSQMESWGALAELCRRYAEHRAESAAEIAD